MNLAANAYTDEPDNDTKSPLERLVAYLNIYTDTKSSLTLTREHLVTLHRYFEFSQTLPTEADRMPAWLGEYAAEDPAFAPDAMWPVVDTIRQHAAQWPSIADESKSLASHLANNTTAIDATAEQILCNYIAHAEGAQAQTWQDVLAIEPATLAVQTKSDIQALLDVFESLMGEVIAYQFIVERISEKTTTFRRALCEQLMPAVGNKCRLVTKTLIARNGLLPGVTMDELDQELKRSATELLAATQIRFFQLLGKGTDSPQDREIFEAHLQRYATASQRRDEMFKALHPESPAEVALLALSRQLTDLNVRLEDVRTAANHLHTAWGSVHAYVSQALKKIPLLEDSRSLATFMIDFTVFVRVWKAIREKAKRVATVFADADANVARGA